MQGKKDILFEACWLDWHDPCSIGGREARKSGNRPKALRPRQIKMKIKLASPFPPCENSSGPESYSGSKLAIKTKSMNLISFIDKKYGWWLEEKATIPAALPKDGLVVRFFRKDVEALLDEKYPFEVEKKRKVWFFNETKDREIAETSFEFVVANPQILWRHCLPVMVMSALDEKMYPL